MDRRHTCLPEVEEANSDAIPVRAQGIKGSHSCDLPAPTIEEVTEKHYRTIPPTPYARPARDTSAQLQKQGRRARRYALYEDVRTLARQGVGIRAIARQLKVSRPVVRRFLHAGEFPEMAPSPSESLGAAYWTNTNPTFSSEGLKGVETVSSSMMRSRLADTQAQPLCSGIFSPVFGKSMSKQEQRKF
jgi:hypothetical protein